MSEGRDSFPSYSYVPGGPFAHPKVHGENEATPPIEDGDWRGSRAYLAGFALFNAGYYWEAHEIWEGLWHAHGRRGPIADLVKGLIKLAAAGVKVRQGQRHGIVTHAARAGLCFESAKQGGGRKLLGLDLDELEAISRRVANRSAEPLTNLESPVTRVFEFIILPS